MDGAPPPPPPPPPHGSTPKGSSGLPPGNYDIFIVPPHSAGSGFLYLPSLRPNTNSFIAGAASAFFCCWLYSVVAPTCKTIMHSITQSGNGPFMLCFTVAVMAIAWYLGRMQPLPPSAGGPDAGYSRQHQSSPPPPQNGYPSGGPNPQAGGGAGYRGNTQGAAGAGWGPNAQGHAGAGYGPSPSGGYGHQQHQYDHSSPPPPPPPPRTEPYGARSESDSSERPKPRPRSYSNASASWQKAKEETRKREEERKRQDDLRKRREEEERKKQEAERQARAAAEKEKWEKMRQREKEVREREAREKIAKERMAKEKEKIEKEQREAKEKEAKEKAEQEAKAEREAKEKAEREARAQAARDRIEKAKSERSGPTFGIGERTNPYAMDNSKTPTPAAAAAQAATASSLGKKPYERPSAQYERPSAQSYVGTATDESYRPYDKARPKHAGSASSFYSSYSESYAPSQSTAQTSPPPSHRGPYSTKDPDKVVIFGVYQFSDSFPKPTVSLVAGQEGWSDGIILRITTEGMFVDDDVKGTGLREWDVKAWAMKGVETTTKNGLHIVRATIRDQENKRYVFVIAESEEWKVAAGLHRLKRGPLVRSFALSTMSPTEATKVLQYVGL